MTLRRSLLILFATSLGLALSGCDLAGSNDTSPTVTAGVFVANQGNFTDANGSVSIYNPASGNAAPNAITGLNSIAQSIRLHDGRLYLAANSAGRLDLFDAATQRPSGQLTGLTGPRYLTLPDDDTALLTGQQPFNVTDPDSVYAINVDDASPEVTASVAVSGTVEGITHTDDHAYASLGAFGANSTVAVLNTDDLALDTEVDIGCTSRFVLADAENEVFALCNNETTGEAVILDGTQVQTRLSLPDSVQTSGSFGQNAYYSPKADELYVVLAAEQVLRINTATNEKGPVLTPPGKGAISAVGYDAVDDRLYVGRTDPSNPFSAAGRVTIHNRSGEKSGSFTAGIYPTYIDFRRADE